MPMPPALPPGSAREIVDRVARGGPAEAEHVVRDTLARIAREDAALGAFSCTLSPEAAAAQARTRQGPLAGVPVGVKDIFDTRELPTAYGSPLLYPPRPAMADAAMVALLQRTGAVVVGKTTTTEFAYLHPTATRNPRAPGRTPGGSSAGSAAAVAAGLVPLAVGTQTGGSVIRPAAYCGVVGYKPSAGWLPTAGLKCFSWSLDTVGLFTRDVADLAVCAEALTGRALQSATAAVPRVVAVPEAYPWEAPSAAAAAAVAAGAAALRALGIELRSVVLPAWAAAGYEAHAVIQGWEAWRCLGREFDDGREQLSPVLRDYLQACSTIHAADYDAAQRTVVRLRAEAQAWLQDIDALLTPSAPDEPPAGHASTGPSSYNRLWTLLGMPCLSVPGGVGPHGAPIGLQLVAAHGADARLLAVGRMLEAGLAGRLDDPPPA